MGPSGDPVLAGHRGAGPGRGRQGLHRDAPAQRRLQPADAASGWSREINATHVGAEMDPSHLFWQGIDPVAAVDHLGDLVFNAAAKDTRINEDLPDLRRPRRPVQPGPADEPAVTSAAATRSTAGPPTRRGTSSRSDAATTWSAGRGSCRRWAGRPDMAVNIEHEDPELDQIEGLRLAAQNLMAAAAAAGI